MFSNDELKIQKMDLNTTVKRITYLLYNVAYGIAWISCEKRSN